MWLDPADPPDPPALGDLGNNSYVRNMPVPLAWGQNKIYGGVVWIGENDVYMENEGSSKQPSWSAIYEAQFAVVLCEGEAIDFLEFYVNEKSLSEVEQEDSIYLQMVGYGGSGTQENDPTIEADLEDDTIPFRYSAYIVCDGKIGKSNNLPTFSCEVICPLTLIDNDEKDANPIQVLYDFLTNKRCGLGISTDLIDGSPTTSGSWKSASDFCDVEVSYTYTGSDGINYSFNAGENSDESTIYADFSEYGAGFFDGCDGYFDFGSFTVSSQTDTYITLSSELPAEPTIGDEFIINKTNVEVVEPRFRYSNVFTNREKAYDIITDILQTCRGYMYYSEGKLKVKIGQANETPVFYFGDNYSYNFMVNNTSSVSRIYADFSSYPVDYWNGDSGTITINSVSHNFIVIDQTSTYIDLADNLSEAPNIADALTINKQNITGGTFSYSRRAARDKNNRIRVEFLNRDDSYRQDFVEDDDVWDINETGEIREQTTSMTGIKRKTQAARIASFLKDASIYTDYMCEFQTDIVGYFLTVGDIIGVTHAAPNWLAKYFRITSLEEVDDYTVKVSCLEYNPNIYHDYANPILHTTSYGIPNPYIKPQNVERLFLFESHNEQKIYITFKKPDSDPYWAKAVIYIQKSIGGTYEFFNSFSYYNASVKLSSSISSSDTTIPYDSATIFDSFPSSGTFFIDEELIYYDSIDDDNDQFLNCIRGYDNTTAASHDDTDYCILLNSSTPYYSYLTSEIGMTISIKAVSINIYDIFADSSSAPTSSIVLNGYYIAPYSVSSLQINSQGSGFILNDSEDSVLTWNSVTDGIFKGYGYSYGGGSGYGGGSLEGVFKYVVRIYKTSTGDLLREVDITDITTTTYTYDVATNTSDNGGSFETDLTFEVYQVNEIGFYSPVSFIVTNT